MMQKQLVLASSNAKKMAEIQHLFQDFADLKIIAQQSLGIASIDEPYGTFLENALAKARHAAKHAKMPALADDSGLCVPFLNGAPGVFSARFAGNGANDAQNNQKLLQSLHNAPDKNAFFVCVFVLVQNENDPLPLVAQGIWHGKILNEPKGNNGFGYDPIFQPEGFQQSAAELSANEKNAFSHRGKALLELKKTLAQWF